MAEKQSSFVVIVKNHLLKGRQEAILLKDIKGFSNHSSVGHVSDLISCVITPVLVKQDGEYVLLNAGDTRLITLLEELSADATISAFVVDSEEHSKDDLTLSRFCLSDFNPLVSSKTKLEEVLRHLSKNFALRQLFKKAIGETKGRDLSGEMIRKALGDHPPSPNTIRKHFSPESSEENSVEPVEPVEQRSVDQNTSNSNNRSEIDETWSIQESHTPEHEICRRSWRKVDPELNFDLICQKLNSINSQAYTRLIKKTLELSNAKGENFLLDMHSLHFEVNTYIEKHEEAIKDELSQ